MTTILKSEFLAPLRVDEKKDDTGAVLVRDFPYYSERLGRVVIVPAGFETDFASVPRLPFAYTLFGGIARWAAVIHDYLYRTPQENVSRADADAVFREAMDLCGVSTWRRSLMWAGVRVFGGSSYNKGERTGDDESEADDLFGGGRGVG